MKKDLYRFAKARKNKRKEFYKLSADEIKMIEYQYYSKFNTIPIKSKRIGKLKGEHIVKYVSSIEEIKISHKSYSRKGFAEGAILAAEFVKNKKGIFSMNDIINTL